MANTTVFTLVMAIKSINRMNVKTTLREFDKYLHNQANAMLKSFTICLCREFGIELLKSIFISLLHVLKYTFFSMR